MTNVSYSQRGLGIMLEAHRVDNMDYRSKRGGTGKRTNFKLHSSNK